MSTSAVDDSGVAGALVLRFALAKLATPHLTHEGAFGQVVALLKIGEELRKVPGVLGLGVQIEERERLKPAALRLDEDSPDERGP